jgi:hypothetical protein
MVNVLDKSCRENQNTHLCSITFSRKSWRLLYNVEKCGGARGHRWRHNMAHTRCMMDKQGYTRMHTLTHPRTHARARTHRPICNTYCFSTATVIREHVSLLRYTYIASFIYDIPPQATKLQIYAYSSISLVTVKRTWKFRSAVRFESLLYLCTWLYQWLTNCVGLERSLRVVLYLMLERNIHVNRGGSVISRCRHRFSSFCRLTLWTHRPVFHVYTDY